MRCNAWGLGVVVAGALFAGRAASAQELKPEVAAVIKQGTAAYKALKSYRHTATGDFIGRTAVEKHSYTLALERPNRFAYKADTEKAETAFAVCDGKTFVNFRGRLKEYTQIPAPADYKGVNIVDDVVFEPLGTYMVALMLQGDPLADKDIKAGLLKATLRPDVMEKGRKLKPLLVPFGKPGIPYVFYFDAATHYLVKVVISVPQQPSVKLIETLEDVKMNKPIEEAAFQFKLPEDAKKVDKFSVPLEQRERDTRRNRPARLAAAK